MSTIYTRATKGSALTWTEGDANITNLNNDKMEKSAPVLAGNLDVATYSITTSTTNGNILIEPNGTGDVHLVTDALRIGDLNTEARISTYGTGNLVLTTNEGNDPDPTITIGNGANADITLTPSGTGIVAIASDLEVGYGTGVAAITSAGAHNLDLVTNGGVNSGVITIQDGINGNIELTPNGTGRVVIDGISHPIADGANGQVLATNGSGVLSFVTRSTTSGTVTSVGGTGTVNGLSLSGTVTSSGNITLGGTLDLTSPPAIGGTTASTGRFTTITSTIATGTAPLTVASTTNVANLNASSLNGATFASPGAIGGTTKAAGTFTTMTADTAVLDDIRETVAALTYAATITPDAADGSIRTITLTGNVTFSAFTNPVSGQTITLIITQDGTGGKTLTSTMKFAGGSKTLSTAANAIDIMTVSYIGTTYYASLSKGFA